MKRILALMVFCAFTTAYGDLTNGLIAYYPFNGNADDESGNSYNGVVSNAILTSDRFGAAVSAYSFNGSSAGINIGNQPVFGFSGDFTLSAWVRATTAQLAKYIVGKHYSIVSNAYGLGTDDSGRMYAFLHNNPTPTGRPEIKNAGPVLADGKWHHLVAVFERDASLRGYLDGTQIGVSYSITNHTKPLTNSYPLYVGRIASGSYFNGGIDDVRIYNRALSPSEVLQLYQYEYGPIVKFVKAFTIDYLSLAIGSNYQLQASSDLITWSNFGTSFTATSINYTNTEYQRIDDWGKLFFRLQLVP
jgi:hypothetical protein